MKIKPSINKNVTVAVQKCREVLVTETINLLKTIGVKQGDEVLFRKMLFLFQHKGNTTETIICDRIMFCASGSTYYIVSLGKDAYVAPVSDLVLSLDSLQVIYEEVRKVVREY